MRTIVVYKSHYGSSREYAKWLAEELQCEARTVNKVTLVDLLACDVIVYIGGLYAGGINGFGKMKKAFADLREKRLVLCMVGMTNPLEWEQYERVFKANVPEQYRELVKPFALRGNQLFSKMSGMHRLMMNFPKAKVAKVPPEQWNEEERSFMESYGKDTRLVNREYMNPVVEYIKRIEN